MDMHVGACVGASVNMCMCFVGRQVCTYACMRVAKVKLSACIPVYIVCTCVYVAICITLGMSVGNMQHALAHSTTCIY